MEGLGATLPSNMNPLAERTGDLHLDATAQTLAWRAVCCDLTATGNCCHREANLPAA